VKSQNDSLREVYQNYPLVHVIDSISRDLRNSDKSIELALGMFGRLGTFRRTEYRGVIIWKDKAKYCGMSIREERSGLKATRVAARKLKHIQLNRLLSDSCDLCELLNGQKRAHIDHPVLMYLKRDSRFPCDEIYFYDVSYLYYNSNSCVYDLRQIMAL
jgi:hypothetical protein